MTKWPLVSRRKYEQALLEVTELRQRALHDALIETADRVRQWAVDANYNIFHADQSRVRAQAQAAFQDAIGRFSPKTLTYRQGGENTELKSDGSYGPKESNNA